MADPRKAKSLGEAAKNPDGTYDGRKALSWLSEVLHPGQGVSVEAIQAELERQKRLRGGVDG